MPYSEFGVSVRAQMLRKGVKGTKIAKELGISNAYLSDILRGARNGEKYKGRIIEILEMEVEKKAG